MESWLQGSTTSDLAQESWTACSTSCSSNLCDILFPLGFGLTYNKALCLRLGFLFLCINAMHVYYNRLPLTICMTTTTKFPISVYQCHACIYAIIDSPLQFVWPLHPHSWSLFYLIIAIVCIKDCDLRRQVLYTHELCSILGTMSIFHNNFILFFGLNLSDCPLDPN